MQNFTGGPESVTRESVHYAAEEQRPCWQHTILGGKNEK